jgi:hypothetical protein
MRLIKSFFFWCVGTVLYCSELVWETLLALVCKICMRFCMIRAYMRSRVSSSVRAYVRGVHAYLYMNGRLQGKTTHGR